MKKEFKLSLSDLKIVDGDRGTNYPKKTDFKNEGYCLFLNAGNITKTGFNDSRCEFITKEKSESLGKGLVQENDIILTTRGSVGNFVHINAKIIKKYPIIRVNSGMIIIRNTNYDISTEYLYYLLNSNVFSKEIDKSISGGVLKQLPINVIKKMNLTYAENNKDAQMRLIKKIIKVENHVSNIKTLLEKIEIRNQYYADNLTSGQLKLNNRVSIINDKFENIVNENKKSKVMAGDSLKEGLYPFFNCSKKQTLFSNDYLIDDSVLLLSTGGTAAVNYYNGKLSYSTDVWCITSKYTKYLYYFYNANIKKVEQCFQGGGLKHLSKKDFKKIEIMIPNNDKDIQDIVDYLDNLNDEKEKVEKLLKLEEQRFEWLSDKLLSGEYIIED